MSSLINLLYFSLSRVNRIYSHMISSKESVPAWKVSHTTWLELNHANTCAVCGLTGDTVG